MKLIKVTGNNEGLYTPEAYKELTLQMSTGDWHTHQHEAVDVTDAEIEAVITLRDLVGTTKVVFKKFPEGDVIALMPDDVCDLHGNITSYMHIGQHGAASPALLIELEDATAEEYEALKHELETHVGYVLEVAS